ncbi:MAG: DNA-binding protein [Anaerolineae bacterium]|nr:MAG: DNA-binding protein [Anaerolineae bacterium]
MTQPKRYALKDKPVTCSHCGGQTFFAREAQLNTAWRSFLDVDWLDESASVLVCSECGHLEWFLSKPKPAA